MTTRQEISFAGAAVVILLFVPACSKRLTREPTSTDNCAASTVMFHNTLIEGNPAVLAIRTSNGGYLIVVDYTGRLGQLSCGNMEGEAFRNPGGGLRFCAYIEPAGASLKLIVPSPKTILGPEILLGQEPKAPGDAISFCVPKTVSFTLFGGYSPGSFANDIPQTITIQGLFKGTLCEGQLKGQLTLGSSSPGGRPSLPRF
jgi:hypothetical protein